MLKKSKFLRNIALNIVKFVIGFIKFLQLNLNFEPESIELIALPTRNPALLRLPASISDAARSPLSPENVGKNTLDGL